MKANNILEWRPKSSATAASLEPTLLWTVRKQQWKIDCILQGRDLDGWSVRVLLNGQWFFCCRFTSLGDAVQSADDKYAELLNGGWAAVSIP
jgi:hypothetical protein